MAPVQRRVKLSTFLWAKGVCSELLTLTCKYDFDLRNYIFPSDWADSKFTKMGWDGGRGWGLIGKREETEWWRPSPRDTRLDRGRNGTQPIITDQAKLSFKDQESIRAGRVWWGWQENNLKCSKLCKSISQAPANIMLTWQIGLTPYTFPEEEYTL